VLLLLLLSQPYSCCGGGSVCAGHVCAAELVDELLCTP
jgi:hypothetical protein